MATAVKLRICWEMYEFLPIIIVPIVKEQHVIPTTDNSGQYTHVRLFYQASVCIP